MRRLILASIGTLVLMINLSNDVFAQTVIWVEDFDDAGASTRWTTETAPGTKTNPTPAGIVGLTYLTNDPVSHDNWIINDRNTPELDGDVSVGLSIVDQGQFVQGHHYDCSAPSNLPNPYVNGGQPGPNQSLHITAYPSCATLLYAGTQQSDDWNCISDPDNGDVQTQTDQIAYLNTNIDATGKCNLVLTADFFLGGDADGLKSHGTILYSIDGGLTWKIVEDNMTTCSPFLAGTCNNWNRRSFALPSDANGQNDLRIAFRWYDDGDINDTGDYALGASFNVDNVMISACDVPTSAFSISQTSGCKGQTFFFTDQSTVGGGYYLDCSSLLSGTCAITNWNWSITKPGLTGVTYVGGTSSSSQNPQVVFTENGTYSVVLTTTNCAGNDAITQTNLITISDCPPTANFNASLLTACAIPAGSQQIVTLNDLSTTPVSPITNYTWSFSPGTVTYMNSTNANSQNPQVIFNAVGTYQVTLSVTSAEGSDNEVKTAYIEALDCNCGGGGGGGPVTVFSEDFDGNGGAGSRWNTAVLNTSIGAQGAYANLWYISDMESGLSPGSCGDFGWGDNSLHVGSSLLGDIGAAYFAGGFFSATTNKRTSSLAINTTGVTGLTLNFNYIENGQATNDDALVQYSLNGGTTWNALSNPAKTNPVPCAPQGLWTAYSIALPATCENITTLLIGFRWVNNNDGIGTDPSFAVDDITITGTSSGGGSANTWQGDVSNNWNTAGNWSSNAVPTATTDALVPATVCGACVMPQISSAAVARDVCNFGTITIVGDNTLTINRDLLNEGAITTTTTNSSGDLIFANTPSLYKGSGTLFDVDVSVTSSDLTLENNIWARSFSISTSGTVNIDVNTLSVNRNFTKTAGTYTSTNGVTAFINACVGCIDQTNTSDVSINANQVFGNILVNKSSTIKASLVSPFNYTVNTPQTVTIQNGILDANTYTLNGTGNLTMIGGELQLAKCSTVLPELSGIYNLSGGKITFDGTCAQSIKQYSSINTNYFKVEFSGSGIKSLMGKTRIADSLVLRLPPASGNYVDAGSDTIFLLNNNAGIVYHTGGHIVGHLNRAILPSGGDYTFHVGSNNSDGETYFEPMILSPTSLSGTSSITGKFFDATPNPTSVIPNITYGFAPSLDTIKFVETEGYWHLKPYSPITGGIYQLKVSPDLTYWSFDQPWGMGYHSLLKQDSEGDPWGYTSGGTRINDSTTAVFSDFSNYALGFANNPLTVLSIELEEYKATCDNGIVYLSWITGSEKNSSLFKIERSFNGSDFELIGNVQAAGNSSFPVNYSFVDQSNNGRSAYYRLIEVDMDGINSQKGLIYSSCDDENKQASLAVYPNPTQGEFTVGFKADFPGTGSLSILDVSGRIIDSEELTVIKGMNLFFVDAIEVSGIYMIHFTMGDKSFTQRLIATD